MSSNFRVDVLLKALEELQKEKSHNENILAEEQCRVKKLELSEASSMFALTQTKESYEKSKETARMEEQRVEQTQEQIQQYEQVNDKIREKIAELTKQIEQIKQDERTNITHFEQRMNELREAFHSGWANMEGSSTEEYETQKSRLEAMAETYQSKIQLLSERIEQELSSNHDDEDQITASTQDEVRKMFEVENTAAKAFVERRQQELGVEELERELTSLLKEYATVDVDTYKREI